LTRLVCTAFVLLFAGASYLRADPLKASVKDPAGLAVANALVRIFTAHGSVLSHSITGLDGVATLDVPSGTYRLRAEASGFGAREAAVSIPFEQDRIEIELPLAAVATAVTVTATRGLTTERTEAAPIVTGVSRDQIQQRAGATAANVLEGLPGVLVQQTTYGQVSPFLRGLTGYQVLTLVDGVRFNNSTFRSGPNQYLAFVPPAQVQFIEAM
jgi:hemoglobin/transferrin/lactoferrin receptor protein